jgi:hypothetical protein
MPKADDFLIKSLLDLLALIKIYFANNLEE